MLARGGNKEHYMGKHLVVKRMPFNSRRVENCVLSSIIGFTARSGTMVHEKLLLQSAALVQQPPSMEDSTSRASSWEAVRN